MMVSVIERGGMRNDRPKILIVDDDKALCRVVSAKLKREGMSPTSVHTLTDGLRVVSEGNYEVVYLDVRMPDGNGLDLIDKVHRLPSAPEVIIITGEAEANGARMAIENGAWDYVEKGSSLDDVFLPLIRALQFRSEKRKSSNRFAIFKREGLVGESRLLLDCLNEAALAAAGDLPVLVTGETGTGKELVAWAIHKNSSRADNNFVVVDCAALPESLVESLLFGHEAGAYTGAGSRKDGLLKQADCGTLFLDEIGELSLKLQKSFLRFLQEHSFRRVGGLEEIRSDFRLITATNRDLGKIAGEGGFRQDLLYRLNSLVITLPPLRMRRDDIQMLTTYRLNQLCDHQGIDRKGFSAEVLEMLGNYDWPGNVRELFNVIDQAVVSAMDDPTIYPTHLPIHIRIKATVDSLKTNGAGNGKSPESPPADQPLSLRSARGKEIALFEKQYLTNLLSVTDWNIKETCRLADISRPRLYELLRKYDLSR